MELALVQLVGDKRPVTVYDLTDGTRLRRRRETTRITQNQDDASKGTVSGVWVIHAQNATELPSLMQELTRRISRPGADEFVEWKTPPSTYPVFMRRLGGGTAQLLTTGWQHALYRRAVFELSLPVEMPPRMLGMDVLDDFAVDSIGDYTFDAGSGIAVANGKLVPSSTAEKRLYHSARGHRYGDVQVTLKFATGAAINADAGVTFKRLDSNNYLSAEASGGILYIYRVDGGVRANLASTAQVLAVSTTYWVRGRIEGDVVTAELFSSEPTPMATPLKTVAVTLAGADASKFGVGIVGHAGIRVGTAAMDWSYDDFRVEPYTYRSRTLPERIALSGAVPGDEPPLVDLHVTPSGGANPPVSAVVGWNERPLVPSAGALVPLGAVEAEADVAGDRATWAVVADAGARGGNVLQASTSGAGTAAAMWLIDPSTLAVKDDIPAELSLEVFAVVKLSAAVVSPKLTLSARPNDGTSFGAERFSEEHGTAGKLLVRPSSGTARRPVRLGTVRVSTDRDRRPLWKLRIGGSWATGSTGAFGLDYLFVAVSRRRAASPVGLANDSAFPKFAASISETTRILRHNGSGQVAKPPNSPIADVGLGVPVTLEAGENDVAVKLSSLAIDDPTSDATSEQLSHTGTLHFRVVPRVSLLRGV